MRLKLPYSVDLAGKCAGADRIQARAIGGTVATELFRADEQCAAWHRIDSAAYARSEVTQGGSVKPMGASGGSGTLDLIERMKLDGLSGSSRHGGLIGWAPLL